MVDQRFQYRSKLHANLASGDIDFITPHLELLDIKLRQEIERPRDLITEVFFPEKGLPSVVAMLEHSRDTDLGAIGREALLQHGDFL